MAEIALEQIKPNPGQPRRTFDDAALQELADSIKEVGLLNPVLVRPNGAGYEIVHGERRWRACQLAGLESIRAEVRELDDEAAFLIAFTENLQRDDLNAMEEAQALQILKDKFGYSQAEIGRRIGKSQQYISGRLALLGLAEPVQEMITTRVVSPSLGRTLSSVPDKRWQTSQAKKAERGELTVSRLENATREWKIKNDKEAFYEVVREFFEYYPELEFLFDAVRKEQIEFIDLGGMRSPGALRLKTTRSKFDGQPWEWPLYSGQNLIVGPGHWLHVEEGKKENYDYWHQLPDVPLFTEEEWEDFCGYRKSHLHFFINSKLSHLGTPYEDHKSWADVLQSPQNDYQYMPGEIDRRTYDPDYGCFLLEPENNNNADPAFIKRGWGLWTVIEFNDGLGGRTRRQFFTHDWFCRSMVEQMAQTVDPLGFSDLNLRRLNIWNAMPTTASWYYVRKKTISKEDAIAALEADLENFRNADPLSDDEFYERLLDGLQNHVLGGRANAVYFREGIQTYPRLPDGSVDAERANEIYET